MIFSRAPLLVRAAGRTSAASPLRYPGGKAALAGFFAELIGRLHITPVKYVEPYAGGVGAGITLLKEGLIDRLVINDIDPAVYAFWVAAVRHSREFADLIAEIPLNVEEWRHQKWLYKQADESDALSLGFAFFYLNRTNRSGLLNAGPIGGISQDGNYKIDARFNRDQLAARVTAIGALRRKITILSRDGISVVKRYARDPGSFVYADPPYVDMGGSLYLNALNHRDHADLAASFDAQANGNWVVTYDVSDFVRRLYRRHDVREYQLSYSAHRTGKASELLIASRSVSQLLVAS